MCNEDVKISPVRSLREGPQLATAALDWATRLVNWLSDARCTPRDTSCLLKSGDKLSDPWDARESCVGRMRWTPNWRHARISRRRPQVAERLRRVAQL